ncbi:hypothetical protein MLD38_022850 [Melastoma candidum]|uniref:Uncharacterized protein n=1 Tax=Melastoma candidum TaxID=119954 RepID=A0ACB9QPK8_9MYRT|nr:hypothetical protein MLD38_022850 [Melastoma candidum]
MGQRPESLRAHRPMGPWDWERCCRLPLWFPGHIQSGTELRGVASFVGRCLVCGKKEKEDGDGGEAVGAHGGVLQEEGRVEEASHAYQSAPPRHPWTRHRHRRLRHLPRRRAGLQPHVQALSLSPSPLIPQRIIWSVGATKWFCRGVIRLQCLVSVLNKSSLS